MTPANSDSESIYRDALAHELNGETEIRTPVGRPDIVTKHEVIEVKSFRYWQAALGQLLAYSYYFPDKGKRLHLIGSAPPEYKNLVARHCQRFDVTVSWVNVPVTRDTTLNVDLGPELKDKLMQRARQEQRSLAALATEAISKAIQDWEASGKRS